MLNDTTVENDFEIGFVERATRLAVVAHEGQKRKVDGLPYIVHPFMVALKLSKHGFSDHVIAAALTHDVLEDTDCTHEQLKDELGNEIYEIVNAVTNDDSLSWEKKKKEVCGNGPKWSRRSQGRSSSG